MFQKLKNIYHLAQAALAAAYFRFPSNDLTVIGVTGTDGKTTTVSMIHHILEEQGQSSGMITSIGATLNHKSMDTGFHVTTPSSWKIQKLLRDAKAAQIKYFVIEATSHGLDQNRLAFIKFHTAVLTNISDEHLDYHKSFENYLSAKLKLFKNVKYSVFNKEYVSLDSVREKISGKTIVYSSSDKQCDFNLSNTPIKLKLKGRYNLENALAASAAVFTLGFPKQGIIRALGNFHGVAGRLQTIDIGQNFTAIVDFAHTPQSLMNVLVALKTEFNTKKGKIIAVFGAAGQRDTKKRPVMGEIAARYANITVITSEDPRKENPEKIARQIASGFLKNKKKEGKDYFIEINRTEAIRFAVNLAKEGDIVCFFGKGHEKSICIGNKELSWNEAKEVENAIKHKLNNEKK